MPVRVNRWDTGGDGRSRFDRPHARRHSIDVYRRLTGHRASPRPGDINPRGLTAAWISVGTISDRFNHDQTSTQPLVETD